MPPATVSEADGDKLSLMGIEQKVAVITGASRGVGSALVRAFQNRNYRIIATARSVRPSNDSDTIAIQGDITDRRTAERAISEGLAHFGRIDTLINTAGLFVARPFTEYSEAECAALLAVNLTGFLHITQLAVAEMEKQGSGHVVQITTATGGQTNTHFPAALPALISGGLIAATKSLAVEYARRGIRVNAIAPGIIKSSMHALKDHEELGALHPVGRLGDVRDIVDAVLYLESASFVTGETLHVSGGQNATH